MGKKELQIAAIAASAGFFLSFLFVNFVFLRLPKRNIPGNNALLVSPANGTVIAVKQFDFSSTAGGPDEDQYITATKQVGGITGAVQVLASDVALVGTIISIELNLFDIHYQRAPAGGTVINTFYSPGQFNDALSFSDQNFFQAKNEHNEILLSDDENQFKYKIVQIAGIVARRIECFVTPSQQIKQGDVIGLINFGSQVVMILPSNLNVQVKEGDALVDGETVIATLSKPTITT